MELIYTIISVILLLAFVVVYILLKRDKKKPAQQGADMGKNMAMKKPLSTAKRFAMINGYSVLQDVNIAKGGKFADFDFVIVGVFGVLCVKCIGFGGEIYGAIDDEKWLQVHKESRNYFENPFKQSEAHTRVLRDCLFANKLKNIPVTSAVVFTNSKASIAVGRSVDYFTPKTFKALLDKALYTTDKGVDAEKVKSAIEEFSA